MDLEAAKSELRNPPGTRWLDFALEAIAIIAAILLVFFLVS